MKIIYIAGRDPWEYFYESLRRIITTYSPRTVCDIGGGAHPSLSLTEITQANIAYTVLDISPAELDSAPAGYTKIVADICARDLRVPGRFDMVFSKMLAEHIQAAELFHKNVYTLLNPGGIAIHFFPTLYALPFLANKLMPEWLGKLLFTRFAQLDTPEHKKFHALYYWCRGPTRRQVRRFEGLKYEVLEYAGFFGHKYYAKIPLLREFHRLCVWIAIRFPNPHFTSFAVVVLRRPQSD